ncbi:hypothetical protein [Butyrivibrio sp. YAB3001]|uniref:hypothetical protein n=1 Tax=Butyrivibrio sp. YAB3001 TaxID=1520812 RepID=UPI0008F61EA4|nr:hypothetical protein [Butyrivibrio sp. YAB3001]SFC85476.1 hypothetical protein SAMN02910398_03332 [Butyrivibrio sp. YAB3001]
MQIKIGEFEYSECWDGVFYKKLSDYPTITEWEIQSALDFENYEKSNGRECDIEASEDILSKINIYRAKYESGYRVSPPEIITECTACPKYKGCLTELVCHTSSIENAIKIIECGRLLSPVRARKMSARELREEKRNAANDPEDYFDYIMFAWGNCQAGDRLVMERKLGRFPDEKDLSTDFTPGVRFFFRYKDLASHPDAVFEGVLPLKVKNEVVLKDYVLRIVVPADYRELLESHIPSNLSSKVSFLKNDTKDIWEWSEKVYEFVRKYDR